MPERNITFISQSAVLSREALSLKLTLLGKSDIELLKKLNYRQNGVNIRD